MPHLLIFLAACAPKGGDSAPTYNADAKPILDANCTTCHNDAGVGPFSLADYASAEPIADSLGTYAANGTMPPWRAAAGCATYANDLTVSADDAATLTAWADGGAGEGSGDPGPVTIGTTALTRTDLSLKVAAAYTPGTDERRCFLLPYTGDDSYVTGFAALPGAAFDVRHVSAFLVPPELAVDYEVLDDADPDEGYACPGGPGAQATVGTTWLGSWTPAARSGDFPAGTGIPIVAGSLVGLQVDYHTNAPEPDQTTALLMLDPAPARPARILPVYDPAWAEPGGLTIPAGAADEVFSYNASVATAETLYSVDVLMRGDGASAGVTANDSTCLVDLPHWDDNWKRAYELSAPITLAAGDTLSVDCHFRNYGDVDVAWGDAEGDEICVAFFYVTDE